jgi:RimK family alpha-L-glutamate ligase
MKIAVIHDAPVPPPTARELLIELMKRGASSVYLRLPKLSSYASSNGLKILYGRSFRDDLDGAIIRGLGIIPSIETLFKRISTLKQLELMGKTVINPPDSILLARDKYRASQRLALSGIPVPETIITEDLFLVPPIVREWGKVVMKPLMGSMGYGSTLVTDPDVAFMIAKAWQSYGQPFLLQKYTRKYDRDLRIFVVGDEVLGGIYRYAPSHTWKTNVTQGGKVSKASLDNELRELALKATSVLGLKYSGVDVGESDDGYVVYEVNTMPNWQGFTLGTGLSPAGKIAELVIKILKK